ncbi:MAG: DNA replication/repair protein RecF [Clostridia bacterium]
MIISKIYLKNYRNYEEQEICPEEGINVVYGKNAQGKTNLLESVYVCSSGRSHRTQKDEVLVREGQTRYDIRIEGKKNKTPFSVSVSYDQENKKTVRVNQLRVEKIGQLMGVLNTVIFSPEDLQIIKNGPLERRRLLDILISQTRPSYFYLLQDYARIIRQKNSILKRSRLDDGLLQVFNEKLAQTGSGIVAQRIEFLKELETHMKQNQGVLSNGREDVSLSYSSSSGAGSWEKDSFYNRLEQEKKNEVKYAVSLIGPHRDDFIITINGRDIRKYGSQGQQRSAVLSLKLGEIRIIREKTGYDPVLLLDDVMSELDVSRRKYLLENIKSRQVFITSTEKKMYASLNGLFTYFHVSGGTVEKKEQSPQERLI